MNFCIRCGVEFAPKRRTSGKYCSFSCAKRVPLEIRFWNHVQKGDDCWLWTGSKNNGYGVIGYNNRTTKAHRASWMLHFREIPEGLLVCHKCDNPSCVRPDHLFLGTTQDNQRDCMNKGRGVLPLLRGSKHGRAKLTEDDVIAIRSEYVPGKFGPIELALKYGVSHAAISYIVSRKTWKHVA